jgi:hypothetical protein
MWVDGAMQMMHASVGVVIALPSFRELGFGVGDGVIGDEIRKQFMCASCFISSRRFPHSYTFWGFKTFFGKTILNREFRPQFAPYF